MTWEEAILWLRVQPERQALVHDCYYDDPLESAAERFRRSEEWQATRRLLEGQLPGRVLDVGAGRGIASYAFASEGCLVTALEPDGSAIVGREAIKALARRTGVTIETTGAGAEAMPFDNGVFDVVYGRAVLHHAQDLRKMCQEVGRVLRPGGRALFVREHVISAASDLPRFLETHPLHPLCGAEHAYRLGEYRAALEEAGLKLRSVLGPLDNVVNYFPLREPEVNRIVASQVIESLPIAPRWGGKLVRAAMTIPGVRRLATRWVSRRMDVPGRHFAFLGVKP